MKTTIRIPDELAAEVQRRADWLGLSFNAVLTIALDAYLGVDRPRGQAGRPVSASKVSQATTPAAEVVAGAEGPVKGSPASLLGLPGLSRQQRRMLERQGGKYTIGTGGES